MRYINEKSLILLPCLLNEAAVFVKLNKVVACTRVRRKKSLIVAIRLAQKRNFLVDTCLPYPILHLKVCKPAISNLAFTTILQRLQTVFLYEL